MTTKSKKILIFWTIGIALIVTLFRWKPDSNGRSIIRILLIINLICILCMSVILQRFFSYRLRTITLMLQTIANAYDTPLSYSAMAVHLIKKQLNNTQNPSYLKTRQHEEQWKSVLCIVHQGQDYEFSHYCIKSDTKDLASVLTYYLQKEVPYEILYDHAKSMHKVLSEH